VKSVYRLLIVYSIKRDIILQIKLIIKREFMNIVVNGEDRKFDDKTTLLSVLKELSLEGKVMAAAVNMEIVKQDAWSDRALNDGDKLELLDFVGGG